MSAAKLAKLLLLALWPLGSGIAAEAAEAPEEILVVGRQPGPPLWKVSKGEHVLWIFPYLDWIPQDMVWDSARVARVIAQSQEVISLPESGLKWSPLLLANPFFVRRSLRNVERIGRNPRGGTLEDNLPPELIARFTALQARYFPHGDYPRAERPAAVSQWLLDVLPEQEGLVPGDEILKTIQRLARRNRGITRTNIAVHVEIGTNHDEYEQSWMAAWENFPPEQEQACFERKLRHIEAALGEMKSRASSWAQGYIDASEATGAFPYDPFWSFTGYHACPEPLLEIGALADLPARVNGMWLDAAETALATNTSTFAILPLDELVAATGLLRQLEARGYEIQEP